MYEVYLPSVTKFDNSAALKKFNERNNNYVILLSRALEMHVSGMLPKHEKASDVRDHALMLVERFSIYTPAALAEKRDVVESISKNVQFMGGQEILRVSNQLFTRTWKKKKFKSSGSGVLFWLDYISGNKKSNSLMLALPEEAYSVPTAHLLARKLKLDTKTQTNRLQILRDHAAKGVNVYQDFVRNQQELENLQTLYHYSYGIKAVAEILTKAPNILLLEPRSGNKSAHLMEKSGSKFIFDMLRYAAATCPQVNLFQNAIDIALPTAINDPMAAVKEITNLVVRNKVFDSKVIKVLVDTSSIDPTYL